MPEHTIPDAAVGWAVSWEERGVPCRRIFMSEDAALNFAAHSLPPLPKRVEELVIKEAAHQALKEPPDA